MKKVNKKLSKCQRAKGIIFTSTLSRYRFEVIGDKTHEVLENDKDKFDKIDRLLDDKFFNSCTAYNFNIIRR